MVKQNTSIVSLESAEIFIDLTLEIGVLSSERFGNRFKGQKDEDGIFTLAFAGSDAPLTLTFSGFDINTEEVRVYLNGEVFTVLPAGQINGLTTYTLEFGPDNLVDVNTLEFRTTGGSREKWGFTDFLLASTETPPPDPDPEPTFDVELVLGEQDGGRYGKRFDGAKNPGSELIVGFQSDGEAVSLSFVGFDIESGELSYSLNGGGSNFLEAGTNEGLASYSIALSADDLLDGQNSITFLHSGSPNEKWGIAELLVVPDPSLSAGLEPTSDTGVLSDDGVTKDNTPSFSGTSLPGALITAFDETGAEIGFTTAEETGDWRLTTSQLGDGLISVTIQADLSGARISETIDLVIDTQAPEAPAISGGEVTSAQSLILSGSAMTGEVVTVSQTGGPGYTTTATPLALAGESDFIPVGLVPEGIVNSGVTLTLESVGNVRSTVQSNNLASPVVIDGTLYIADQRGGVVYKFDEGDAGGTATEVFNVDINPPDILTFSDPFSIMNIADGPGGSVYVVFTSQDLPDGVTPEALPDNDLYLRSSMNYQLVYKYEANPFDGTEGEPDPILLAAFEQVPGHRGGGLLTLPNGDLLFARGDNLGFNFDGLSFAQDNNFTVSKLLVIDQDTGAITVAAEGVRNVQRLTYADDAKTMIAFAEIGANIADEINVVSVADLLDASEVENFGWGRIPGDDSDGDGTDGTAREGTFYINGGETETPGEDPIALGEAPLGEDGFIQPYAQAGSEGPDLFALSGPVYSESYFTWIEALFGDLVSGEVYATIETDNGAFKTVYHVNLEDQSGASVDLLAEANAFGLNRVDVRFFEFADGQPGLLSEQTGEIYRLTETTDYEVGYWEVETSELSAGTYEFTAQSSDVAGNLSPASDVFEFTVPVASVEDDLSL